MIDWERHERRRRYRAEFEVRYAEQLRRSWLLRFLDRHDPERMWVPAFMLTVIIALVYVVLRWG